MAYRRTTKMATRLAATRERIADAALSLVARGGYGAADVTAIAAEAGVSTGLLYRYFPSKADLFDEVFQRASQREIDACTAAASLPGNSRERLARVVETFARRALRGRRLAWALLAEPVDPLIEADRVRFREPYRAIFAGIIRRGIESGEVAPQDARTVAAGMVGAIAEALLGPLSEPPHPDDEDTLIATVTRLCVQSLGQKPESTIR
ncbi:MAG: TetR/AcrR family transcriptional regulator [Rhodanobacter sp.]|nr:MAG: TetR/AcrR family transcriptional regulator [Rhodanobacter sp.]